MALTQSDLDNLEAALAAGQKKVSYDGKDVEFHSVKDLKDAIAYVRGQLDAASVDGVESQSLIAFSRD